jgi:hypothetical protein
MALISDTDTYPQNNGYQIYVVIEGQYIFN